MPLILFRHQPSQCTRRVESAERLPSLRTRTPGDLGGDTLHAGFATQAFLNGAAEVAIMRQTRHKSLNTLRKYIRDRSLFRDNPAAKLGL
jgi:hypothetical protein